MGLVSANGDRLRFRDRWIYEVVAGTGKRKEIASLVLVDKAWGARTKVDSKQPMEKPVRFGVSEGDWVLDIGLKTQWLIYRLGLIGGER